MEKTRSRPHVFVVSAPSGAGKTTLNRRLTDECSDIQVAISHTTRAPRNNEQDGTHYHFVSKQSFEELIINESFLEWAEVHGNFYGTSKDEIRRLNAAGISPILEIDVQGWQLAREHLDDATSIFIMPPSLETLWQRLANRGSDSLKSRWLRLQNAYREIEIADHYDFFLVNDDLEQAYGDLKAIVVEGKRGKMSTKEGLALRDQLKHEYKHGEWIIALRRQLREH